VPGGLLVAQVGRDTPEPATGRRDTSLCGVVQDSGVTVIDDLCGVMAIDCSGSSEETQGSSPPSAANLQTSVNPKDDATRAGCEPPKYTCVVIRPDEAEAIRRLQRSCPVCGNGHGRVLHSQELVAPDEFSTESAFDITECSECGMVFADTVVRQEVLNDLYRDHSKYADTSTFASVTSAVGAEFASDAATAKAAPEAPWDLDRLERTAEYLATMVTNRDARILDAGCATGALLEFLGGHGFGALTGLDPSPIATAAASRRNGIKAVTGSFLDPHPELGRFDVVVLSHVLEHLADVQGAASALRSLLAPDGLVYLEVPDASRYGDYLVAPFHDFNTEHINHFSLPLLNRLLDSHEFEPIDEKESTVFCSANDEYPVTFGLWKPARQSGSVDPPEPDLHLATGIRRYVARSRELLGRIDSRLRRVISPGDDVMVWGAGQLTMKLLRDTVLFDADVIGIIDSSPQKQGLHFNGVSVIPPDVAAADSCPVVIGSIHHAPEIARAAVSHLGEDRHLVFLTQLPERAPA
jgi:2-polyprenyl-3-methyl-5-hydroxy-6-metoxy-1,4-benzoquinol methylase